MRFGFLWTEDVVDKVRVDDSVIFGDLGLVNEEYCAGSLYSFGGGPREAEAMGKESTPFICKGAFPDGGVGTEEEFGKGALFASRWWSGGERSDVVGVSFVGGALG